MSATNTEIVELHERESRVFPRGDFFDAQGRSTIFSLARSLSAIEIKETLEGTQLRVLGLVGFLPLTANISLNLKPKFPMDNLWYMIEVADESCEKLLPVIRSYQDSKWAAPTQLLARSFCFFLKTISELGISKNYVKKEFDGYFRPKMNFGRTVSRYLSRGNALTISSDVFEFSNDLSANGYLKSACVDFLTVIPREEAFSFERSVIIDVLNALDRVPPLALGADYQDCFRSVPSWLLESYEGALSSYSVFLGQKRIGFSYSPSSSKFPSFIFSLDDIFEDFVRNFIRAFFRSLNVLVLDGNVPSNYGTLFSDNKAYPVKPDLIFKNRSGHVLCIGEVKYKPKIKDVDRYQLISHVISMGCSIGVWISPSKNSETTIDYVGSVSTGARFYHCKVDISNDLRSSAEEMAKKIGELMNIN